MYRCSTGLAVAGLLLALGAAAPPPARGAGGGYAISAYGGLATWIDIYDSGPWKRPERTVRRLDRRGVRTLFVQTSNHRQSYALHRRAALARLLGAAQRRGLRAVAWYLPGLDRPRRDWRRVKAALTHVSAAGHRFDGFAMDIEATNVRDIPTRNRRLLWLSGRLRRFVGERAALGAIIPDPVTQRYWPRFPYRRLTRHYDAFMPMSYWTLYGRRPAQVYRYTRRTIRLIRARSADPSLPVHMIGGLASHASVAEVRSFTRAAVRFGAAGASLYDAPITSTVQWNELGRIGRLASPVDSRGP